jgi:hypothetical protein
MYDPNAFGSTFAFFQPHKAKQKCKRATNQTHGKATKTIPTQNCTTYNKRFERKVPKSLQLKVFNNKKVVSSYQHLSVKSVLRQAAKPLSLIVISSNYSILMNI